MNNIVLTPVNYQIFSTNTFTTLLSKAFVYGNNEKFITLITNHAFYEIIDNHRNKFYTKPEFWLLHTSFVLEGECINQIECLFNQPLYHKRKYR